MGDHIRESTKKVWGEKMSEELRPQRWCFMMDDDAHDYLIPVEKRERFDELDQMGEDGEDMLNAEFSKYRADSIASYSFENPQRDL
jgi:hypothetical protein